MAAYGSGALMAGQRSGAIDMVAQLNSRGRRDLMLGYINDQGWQWSQTGGGVESDSASSVVQQKGTRITVAGSYGKSGEFGAINSVAKGLQELYVWQFTLQP